MAENQNKKPYNLEERTLSFAREVNRYVNVLPRIISNVEIGKQLVRSAGSVGANYIEANEALSKKDFTMRVKISRKEAKESQYWLDLSEPNDKEAAKRSDLLREAVELRKILSAIISRSV